jgi:exonuclease III
MEHRAISWNLQHTAEDFGNRIRLLRDLDERFGPFHVLFLQELTTDTWELLAQELGEVDGAWSWHREPGLDAETRTGAGILVRSPFALSASGALPEAPSKKRTLTGMIDTEHGPLAVASCALPPGHDRGPWREQKVVQSDAIVAWIQKQRSAGTMVLVGIDANTPRVDHPELAETDFWFPGEARLLGSHEDGEDGEFVRTTDVADAFRTQLTHQDLAAIAALRPEGPLAVSHARGSYSKVPCRYDYLLASPELQPRQVRTCTRRPSPRAVTMPSSTASSTCPDLEGVQIPRAGAAHHQRPPACPSPSLGNLAEPPSCQVRAMRVHVVSWNLNGRSGNWPYALDLAASDQPDVGVVLAQESKPPDGADGTDSRAVLTMRRLANRHGLG